MIRKIYFCSFAIKPCLFVSFCHVRTCFTAFFWDSVLPGFLKGTSSTVVHRINVHIDAQRLLNFAGSYPSTCSFVGTKVLWFQFFQSTL